MWQCPKCREKVEDRLVVCWSCGTTPDGVEDPDFGKSEEFPYRSGPSASTAVAKTPPPAPRPPGGSEHGAEVRWERNGAVFTDSRYRRDHRWRFDGGLEVPASASPSVVPAAHVDPAAVDPEEAFVAALASCHMLWFLSVAAKRGFTVERYRDAATGVLGAFEGGRKGITRVVLRPEVEFAGAARPSAAEHEALHREAHERCFIAASVRTEVLCEPAFGPSAGKRAPR